MVRDYKRKTEDIWTKEDLLEALVTIKEQNMNINEASRQFGMSRATIYRHNRKFIQAGGNLDISHFRNRGGNLILTPVEEDILEKTILDLRGQGISVTASDIKRICFEYCDSNSIINRFNTEKRMASDDWYYGFLKRHLNLKNKRKSENKKSATTGKKRKLKGEKQQGQGKVMKSGKSIKIKVDDNDNIDDDYKLSAHVAEIFNQPNNEENEDSNNNKAEVSVDADYENCNGLENGDNINISYDNFKLMAMDMDVEMIIEIDMDEPKAENFDNDLTMNFERQV